MASTLVKGQKVDITKNAEGINLLHVGFDWQTTSDMDVDASAFLIGEHGKIIREEDFVFYGQPSSNNGSVRLEDSMSTIEKQRFIINLSKIPEEIQKISFTLTIYESDKKGLTFSDVSEIKLRIINSRLQQEVAIFPIDYDFTQESAVVLGTLYRYSGEWKFHAVGAGFYGGLADLCREYGVEILDEEENTTPTSDLPNNRFQVVQERDNVGEGEVIPNPPSEHVQLKRSSTVHFDQSRIDELSNQSTELVNLFTEQENSSNNMVLDNPKINNQEFNLVSEVSEEDQDGFIHSLSDTELSFLKLMGNGKVSTQEANHFLRQRGIMPAIFINSINEKATEHLGDNLLMEDNEFLFAYEEYSSIIEDLKERVGNEY
ncbi:TPA: hypothetical protein G9C53_004933 [Salmonella enterica subsp. enterica serovar Typhimurium var. 5-]|uniref:TerD family protein n=1 Tax=Salmonella enterica subsp. enterica serovar Typhimurium var. 5- TaxID=1620419 RepID=A0A740TKM3_SALTM|nr:hypothetical protein [Salmonella enterica subsp. enterica serovar Typhimurium var. 5-]